MVLSRQAYIARCSNCGTKNRISKSRIDDRPLCGKCKTPLSTERLFPEHPLELTDLTFPHEILTFPGPSVVYFWSPGCVYCKSLGPIIDHLASVHGGSIKFAKVLLESSPLVSNKLSVMGVPTILLFQKGKEVDRLVGELPREQLEERLRRFAS